MTQPPSREPRSGYEDVRTELGRTFLAIIGQQRGVPYVPALLAAVDQYVEAASPSPGPDLREALERVERDMMRRYSRLPEEGADSEDAHMATVVHDIMESVRAAFTPATPREPTPET